MGLTAAEAVGQHALADLDATVFAVVLEAAVERFLAGQGATDAGLERRFVDGDRATTTKLSQQRQLNWTTPGPQTRSAERLRPARKAALVSYS